MIHSLLLVFYDLLILGGLFLLGALAVRAILGKADWLATLSLSLGLGGGLFAWSMFIASWSGLHLGVVTVLVLFAALAVVLALVAWHWGKLPMTERAAVDGSPARMEVWLTRGLWMVISIMILAAVILSVGLSYFGWDDISVWVIKAYGIALQGTIFAGSTWGGVGLAYPLNLTLLIALFRILDGNLLPGSKLLYPVYYASLLIGCYRFWVWHGLRRWIASLGVILLASTPILFTHAYLGYANLAFTFYLTMGILWCIDGIKDGEKRKTLLGGILLAIALWTRPEGFVMCAAVVVAFLLARLLTGNGKLQLLFLLLPVLLVGGTWFIFLRLYAAAVNTASSIAGPAILGLLAGQMRWSALLTILRFFAGLVLRFRDWGFLPALMGLLLVVGLRKLNLRHDYTRAALLFVTVTIGLVMIGFQFSAAYSTNDPNFVYDWLSLEFTRLALPALLSLTLLGLLTLKELS